MCVCSQAQHYANEIQYTISEANQLIATLGENNPVLRNVLGEAVNEMIDSQFRVAEGMIPAEAYYGRRLMQRKNLYPEYLTDVLVDHPIQTKYRYGIPGVSRETCEALCDGEKRRLELVILSPIQNSDKKALLMIQVSV